MRMLPFLAIAAFAVAFSAEHPRTDSAPASPGKQVAPGPAKTPEAKAHAEATHPQAGQGEENGRTPSRAPRPDTSFARASDWETGEAEILNYAVKRVATEGETNGRGRLLTERLWQRHDGILERPSKGAPRRQDDSEILNAALLEEGGGEVPFSIETVCRFPRTGEFKLLRQEQSLQGWPGTTHRSLDCVAQPPHLRIASSGDEVPVDTLLTRWPVYTEEMLFTYLRSIPMQAGYREEIWLQDWGREGGFRLFPRYASITVHSEIKKVRDVDAWYVTVDRDGGRPSQFWVGASGLHPVVVAELSDGTEWILQGTSRKKYWSR